MLATIDTFTFGQVSEHNLLNTIEAINGVQHHNQTYYNETKLPICRRSSQRYLRFRELLDLAFLNVFISNLQGLPLKPWLNGQDEHDDAIQCYLAHVATQILRRAFSLYNLHSNTIDPLPDIQCLNVKQKANDAVAGAYS